MDDLLGAEQGDVLGLVEPGLDLLLDGEGDVNRQRRHGGREELAGRRIDGGPIDALADGLGQPLAQAVAEGGGHERGAPELRNFELPLTPLELAPCTTSLAPRRRVTTAPAPVT